MGRIVGAFASSHAFAIENPTGWDVKRNRNRAHYRDRYGDLPPDDPRVSEETDEEVATRYRRISGAHQEARQRLLGLDPDTIVLIGDDQDECFTDGNYPQIAIYLGGDFEARGIDRSDPRHKRRSDPELARAIFETLIGADVDAASLSVLANDYLPSHAFGPLLQLLETTGAVPVVPVFINAIHVPAPSPRRCYLIGTLIRQAVEQHGGKRRVVIAGSGGLSHFPSSFPPGFHGPEQPFPWGSIDVTFDTWIIERLRTGDGAALAELGPVELLKHGEAELRSWIGVAGAVGEVRPSVLVYEAFHRGIMGMGVAWWDLDSELRA